MKNASESNNDAGNRRILLIDDSQDIHEDFKKILVRSDHSRADLRSAADDFFGADAEPPSTDCGPADFEIESALQGLEGVERARERLLENRPFALAFVDVRMPPGIDGIETISRLWRIDPDLQIVICTAYSDYSWEDMIERLGQSDKLIILKKPFDSVEVLQLAHAMTGKWQAERDAALRHEDLERRVELRTAELHRSQRELRVHVERTPLGVIECDLKAVITSWNPAAAAIFGWSAEEAIGQPFAELLGAPEPPAGNTEPITLDHQRRCVVNCHNRKGEVIVTEWYHTLLVDEEHRPFGVASLVLDVTQRTAAERALRQSEARFSKAFNASPVSLGMVELPEGRFLDVNESFVRDFGYTREELVGRTLCEVGLWAEPAHEQALIREHAEGRSIRDFESPLRTAEGTIRNTLISAERIELDDRDCVLFQIYDLTERLDLEARLRQSQKMEAIGQLAAGVAHDFNNILTIIDGHTSLLADEVPREHQATVEEIALATTRAANLTRKLLAFSRQQTPPSRSLNLNNAVRASASVLQRLLGESIALKLNLPDTPVTVRTDPGMIEQILSNLCVNAREAIADGGEIRISVEKVTLTEEKVAQVPDARVGDFVCLSVSDTGCGMSLEIRERVFEPFFTTKPIGKGSGLGLASVFGVVKQLGGWINVLSEQDEGSVFRIWLPSAPSSSGTPGKPVEAPRKGAGVLVTESEPSRRRMMEITLRSHGYRVFIAHHERHAFELWKQHSGEIALLVNDLTLGGPVQGRELAKHALSERPDLKVIYTGGADLDGVLGERDCFLRKPFDMNQLGERVRAAFADELGENCNAEM